MGVEKVRRGTQKQLIWLTSARRGLLAGGTAIKAAVSAPGAVNDLVPKLVVKQKPINSIKPPSRRLRKARKGHSETLIKSLKTVGQIAPILIDCEDRVVDGYNILLAMKELGLTNINCVRLDHLTDEQISFARIALNKLAEGSEWELEELRPALEELNLVGFDLTGTGFTLPELDILLQPLVAEAPADTEELPEPPEQPVSRLGDLWRLNAHDLLCGDALELRSYALLLGMRTANAVFTDCPWNIPIEGFVSGKGGTQHKDFKMAAGEMTGEAFQEFVDTFTQHCTTHLADGGVLFSCIDWRSVNRIIAAGEKAGLSYINMAIWNKGSGGMGGLYRSAHELVPVFCKGKTPTINNVQLGRHGRDRTNVWSYPGANRPGSSSGKALKHHPTPKPVEMVEDAILDVTSRGELVLDPFMGSGTTLLAAERSGRVCAGIELDPGYVDVCIRRWEDLTGKEAVHADEGVTFREMARLRGQGHDMDTGGEDEEQND